MNVWLHFQKVFMCFELLFQNSLIHFSNDMTFSEVVNICQSINQYATSTDNV